MTDGRSFSRSGASLFDFATWAPVLQLQRADGLRRNGVPPTRVAGRISVQGWDLGVERQASPAGGSARIEGMQVEIDAVRLVLDALQEARVGEVSFTAQIGQGGHTVLRLTVSSPAASTGIGRPYTETLVLVEGAVPEPWSRLPDPSPSAVPAPTADPELLERTLRERMPGAIGATEEEIKAAEERLGIVLPDELKAVFRVTRALWEDWDGDVEMYDRYSEIPGFGLLPLGALYLPDPSSRYLAWEYGAGQVVVKPPDAAVQGLVGSPGWIVFADNGGDQAAIDLTPGPRGHTGQIILISHEQSTGAHLVADSLTDLVLGRTRSDHRNPWHIDSPAVARINGHKPGNVEDAAHPGLEVLSIHTGQDRTHSLAAAAGLPRLRTLKAEPGTLADPLDITGLTALEYLELGTADWRALLDAGAVPEGLLAVTVSGDGRAEFHDEVATVANEILALHGLPLIPQALIEGALDPAT
ncbi:SMI1/KNR4 family protein [Streptomyces qinzhouensis]|uniref:SMI1/KNR4 family protein n=1 Tax=Streptomyces qinzhouensis TaxID=2599401 RepID=A0A5B8JJK5_9ACTN|nr:SMI1/KNR4 family protein [Streptomyces qinzhouensis]QDY80011.1 SMI1/KNR4 family protein [Streptomyces qinzhouensis]